MSKAIPERWKKVRFDSVLSTIESGRRPKGGSLNINDGIPSIGGEHITSSGGFNFKNTRYVPEKFYGELTTGKIKTGDVLIVKDGATTGKVAIVQENFPFKEACINEHIFILRGNQSLINPFLFYHLYSKNGQQQIANTFQGSAQGGINYSFIKNCDILLPPLPEQQKIAAILSSVDAAIEKTKAVIEQTKVVKRGLMQELLIRGIPGWHKKFKKTLMGEIPEEWKIVKLGDICLKIQDGTHFSPKSKTGPRMYVTSKNIRMGYIDMSKVSFISEEEHAEIYKRCDVKFGDVLLTKDGAQAGNLAINTIKEEFSLLSSVALIRPNQNKISPHYIFQFYASNHGQTIISNEISGQAITRLTLDKIKRLLIILPPISEQQIITDILNSMDKTETMNRNILDKLISLKSALMQVLLTGKIRVKI